MTRKKTRIAWSCLLILIAWGQAWAVAEADPFEKARATILQALNDTGAPSISVAVAHKGKTVWEESFGWADRERMIKATPNTMYSMASVSKPLTATGLLILAERKLVDLNENADAYLGPSKLRAVDPSWPQPTVKHVMNHTAGLPLHYQFFYQDEPFRRPSMDETIARYGFLVAPPGERYFYSNLGYGILDDIISRVSGRSYAEFMRTEVFLPLGMTHSSVGVGPGLEAFAAQRYDARQRPLPSYTFDHDGASAIYASAHDLVRFGMFHLKDHLADQRAILKDETIDLMKSEKESTTPRRNYLLGWTINANQRGYQSFGHGGGMPGVSTSLRLIPSEDIAVVVLCNKSGNSAGGRIADEIFAALLPKYAENLKADSRPQPNRERKNEKFAPTPALLGEWTGEIRTYSGAMPLTLVIANNGGIHVRIKDQMETLLNDVSYQEEVLQGKCYGTIKTEDAARSAHYLNFGMKLRGDSMIGLVSAMGDSIKDRMYFALSSPVLLKKTK